MTTTNARRLSAGLLLGAAGIALAGCSSGPTYGTGTSQTQQLFGDIDGMFSLGSSNRGEEISYAPRPELVRPASIGALPPPRPAAMAANDPNWPQSPEVIRARNLAAAEATRGDGVLPADFNPSQGGRTAARGDVTPATPDRAARDASWLNPQLLQGQSRQATVQRAATTQGSPTQRRYLSEPPVNYRQPVASAPVGDMGVDEAVKQRRSEGVRPLGARIREALPF